MNLYPHFSFQITHQAQDSRARTGVINTPHGALETPAFIFCATKGAIKGLAPEQMKQAGTQIILANTYHMFIQPGGELVAEMGGLHKFMAWDGPMLTDSGGFQIFSLGCGSVANEIKGKRLGEGRQKTMLKISEEGALFKSYLNGAMHLLTPELSMDIQRQLGPDLVVMFDECTPYHVDKTYTERSMQLSHRWGKRSLTRFSETNDGKQAIYGIVQGGVYPELRKESAAFVNEHDFFASAIGGSLGADKAQMQDVVAMTMAELNPERPVHLLGIGGLADIIHGVQQGIDTFDCVHPTRLARHGGALVPPHVAVGAREHINLRNAQFARDQQPIEPGCPCATCRDFSRAYLHYTLKAKELIAFQAITLHNVTFMNRFLTAIRQGIRAGNLAAVAKAWVG